MTHLPLRVDYSGSWLDVPRYAIPGAYICNMAISPTVSLIKSSLIDVPNGELMTWTSAGEPPTYLPVPCGSGLGTSAAWHLLHGRDALAEELASGAGWQDPGILCDPKGGIIVWASGPEPVLVHRDSGDWLHGLLALHWTGKSHDTKSLVDLPRDYNAIASASHIACKAVMRQDVRSLAEAIDMSYIQQREEGMEFLPVIGLAAKYCGAGHGGYAVYLFESQRQRDRAVSEKGMMAIEPYWK